MNQVIAAADGAWRVLLAGLLLGAGLPALFALGIRQLAAAHVPDTAGARWHPGLHRAAAYVSFAVVVLAVLLGLSYIVAHGFGYVITFDGIIPVVRPKK
nr:hypothetical protein [Propionibacterium sp.]